MDSTVTAATCTIGSIYAVCSNSLLAIQGIISSCGIDLCMSYSFFFFLTKVRLREVKNNTFEISKYRGMPSYCPSL